MMIKAKLILMLFVAFMSISAYAAEISRAVGFHGRQMNGLLLEGDIVEGDFEKFKREVIANPNLDTLFLASKGGNLREALKIGELVRELYYTTFAPIEATREWIKLKDKSNNLCASSCFFIFVAGFQRFGAVVGIHRPYLSNDSYRSISLADAKKQNDVVREVVGSYFTKMGVPLSYLDRMMSIPASEVVWLKHEEIKTDFDGYIHGIAYWMGANCQTVSDADEKRIDNIRRAIPKNRAHLNFSDAPSREEDRAFVKKYIMKKELERICQADHLMMERKEVIRRLSTNNGAK